MVPNLPDSKPTIIHFDRRKLFKVVRYLGSNASVDGDTVVLFKRNIPSYKRNARYMSETFLLRRLARRHFLHTTTVFDVSNADLSITNTFTSNETVDSYKTPLNNPFCRASHHFSNRIEMDRITFLKLVSLLTPNHDDEIIGRRIMPSLGLNPFETQVYGTSLKDCTHYLAGLFKRIIPDYPVDPDLYDEFDQFFQSELKQIEPIPHIQPYSHENLDIYWLNDTEKYTLKQKKHFHDLLDLYLNEHKTRGMYDCQSFIKNEFYAEPKFARLINSRSDLFKVLTAPYIKLIEEIIFVKTYPEHFIKHKQPEWTSQRLKQMFQNYHFVYETDYSSFESSFSLDILLLEYKFFSHMLQNNPEILTLFYDALLNDNTIISSLGISATFAGTRMSGEMWTSLGNGFMNMMLIKFMAHKDNLQCDFLVEGDDGAACFNRPPNYQYVNDLGFRIKLVKGSQINDLNFCGIKVRRDGKPMADISRTFRNNSYSRRREIINMKETRKFKFKEYQEAVLLSLYHRTRFTPFLAEYSYHFLKHVIPNLEKYKDYMNYWQYQQVILFDRTEIEEPIYDNEYYQSYLDLGYGKQTVDLLRKQIYNMTPDDHIYLNEHL